MARAEQAETSIFVTENLVLKYVQSETPTTEIEISCQVSDIYHVSLEPHVMHCENVIEK